MNPIQSFHCKLRGLATKLDGETARLLRALDGEDSEDFEVSPVRILYDLHSEVQTLKDNVSALLDKARLGSQESTSFIKATKILMIKNSADIMNIRDFFQKYGYQARDKEDSAHELGVSTSNPELAVCKDIHEPGGKEEQSDPCVPSGSVSEELLRSPQLSDFGLQRYMVSQVPANPPQTNVSLQEEGVSESPAKESSVQMPKTPRCALKMDDFECVTPKLEHFGISEYTMCLNEDYTMGLKNMKNIKSSPLSGASGEAIGTEPVTSANSLAIPGPIIQQLEKNDVEYINSPLPPKFCTPGLKIPSTMDSTDLVSLDYPLSKPNSSSTDLEVKDCTPLILNSDECYQSIADSPTPTVTSCENFTTPSPPKVTAIPEDILQMLKHNSNLAYSTDVKALPLKGFLTYKGQSSRGAANKENW